MTFKILGIPIDYFAVVLVTLCAHDFIMKLY